MTEIEGSKTAVQPEPLAISRVFAAPRALVFQAWSSAEHIEQWFSPEGLTTAEAEIDFRTGGVFAACMRAPDGQAFWSRGKFLEVSPTDRLGFVSSVGDPASPGFTAHTTVTFEDCGAGTRMSVVQAYEIHDPAFIGSVDGAPEGWRTTLDKLEREVERIRAAAQGQAVHDAFTLERTYPHAPSAVFRALTDPAAKARWFGGGDGYTVLEREMDVRPGGRERLKGRWTSGVTATFEARYFDVVPDRRLVYAYEMYMGERKISVSLATMTLQPDGAGTRLSVTEQGVFLDGYADAGSREHGTGFLLDRLGASLMG